jgi:hypothetical protein
MLRRIAFCVCLIVAPALATTSAAQGNGHANGHAKNPKPPSSTAAAAAAGPSAAGTGEIQIAGTGIRNFGSWLDDASLVAPGQGFMSLGFGLWKMSGYQEVDLPTIDTAVGINRRLQVGVSAPFYHANEPGGPTARGVGNMYLSSKILLRDASSHPLGFSVTPSLEVLSSAPPDQSRVSWALPVNLEVQRTGWRFYGSTGYFSRGALFASGAIEAALTDRSWITGTISHSHSIHPDPLSAALGLTQTRTDIAGGASVSVSPNMAVFGSVGRTISRHDANSTNLMLTGGVAFNFAVR